MIPTVKSTHPLLHSYFFVEGLKSLLVNSKYTILYDNYTKTACSPNVWAPHTAAMLTSRVAPTSACAAAVSALFAFLISAIEVFFSFVP